MNDTQDYEVGDVIFWIIKSLVMDRYKDLRSWLTEIKNTNKNRFSHIAIVDRESWPILWILGTDTDHV